MGAKLDSPVGVAVGVTQAEAGVVCAASVTANWSKQADDVACAQHSGENFASEPQVTDERMMRIAAGSRYLRYSHLR
jgi:hypothetical protein